MVHSTLLAHLPDAGATVGWESHSVWKVDRKAAALWVPGINPSHSFSCVYFSSGEASSLIKDFLVGS